MDDYVECVECGHPVEKHPWGQGCINGDCTCDERFTVSEVLNLRRAKGLPLRYRAEDY